MSTVDQTQGIVQPAVGNHAEQAAPLAAPAPATPEAAPVAVGGSLRDRVEQRRRELERQPEQTILLPIPGYEDLLVAQYRALRYREMFAIESRHESNPDKAEGTLFALADKLIAACERILEPVGYDEDGHETYQDTGHRYNARAARELFGAELPEGATARQALLAIFGDADGEERLVLHGADYERERQRVRQHSDSRAEGESQAR